MAYKHIKDILLSNMKYILIHLSNTFTLLNHVLTWLLWAASTLENEEQILPLKLAYVVSDNLCITIIKDKF